MEKKRKHYTPDYKERWIKRHTRLSLRLPEKEKPQAEQLELGINIERKKGERKRRE